MTKWSLPELLADLHDQIQGDLETARKLGHPTEAGDASEAVWNKLLNDYLPHRYEAGKGFVVDSKGTFSQQIDVLIFDRQYTPFVFHFKGALVVPAEAVYAVFEAKQVLTAEYVKYAQTKAASVRQLYRTSAPIHTRGKAEDPRDHFPILSGILALESAWKPAFGEPLTNSLVKNVNVGQLDLGCVATHGHFQFDKTGYTFIESGRAVTGFLFELIARLQSLGTVPAIDIRAYAAWLR